MFGQLNDLMGEALGAGNGATILAVQQFEAQSSAASLRTLAARLVGRSNRLLRLNPRDGGAGRKSFLGLRSVPIRKIKGSEGREDDFDAGFRPMKAHDRDRWVGVLLAMRRGCSLPPVELIQVGDIYYVRDGHHRISAASLLGYTEIEATVTLWE